MIEALKINFVIEGEGGCHSLNTPNVEILSSSIK